MSYTLPHIISNSAKSHPDKVAFISGAHTRTYKQMANEIDQLANVLHEQGIRKGDRVGIYINRSIETAVAIFGIMRAGAIYVPLDTNSPVSLTHYLVKDCGIRLIISHPSQRRKLSALTEEEESTIDTVVGWKGNQSVKVITWEEVYTADTELTATFQFQEHDPAYIIYTSGSTGRPKGIVHTHSSGLAYAKLSVDTFNICKDDKIANHAPVFFDISLLGYFAGPLVGATTVIIPDAYTVLPTSLASLIEKEQITIWYSVPLALIQMLQSGALSNLDVSALRWVMYAGEPFPPKYLRRLMEMWPDASFCNKYGPAETNVCTYYTIPTIIDSEDAISIGKTWANTEMHIVDEQDQLIEKGNIGELLIRSTTTMLEYWQDPEKTSNAFCMRKGNGGTEERFYRTGDLVREDDDGLLHFLGRKDHQIKTRGYRVELGSVEAALVSHNEVEEAVVYPTKLADETISISAAVILARNSALEKQAIFSYMIERLPPYAVPTEITLLENFPRTGSGKTNRPALIDQLTKSI